MEIMLRSLVGSYFGRRLQGSGCGLPVSSEKAYALAVTRNSAQHKYTLVSLSFYSHTNTHTTHNASQQDLSKMHPSMRVPKSQGETDLLGEVGGR